MIWETVSVAVIEGSYSRPRMGVVRAEGKGVRVQQLGDQTVSGTGTEAPAGR